MLTCNRITQDGKHRIFLYPVMKITIHRGINQIGCCITEISTSETRILIDLGQSLPDSEGIVKDNISNREAIENITQGSMLYFTHIITATI